jgi:tetrahydromethanopterin S-methyltransferase subunit D
MEFNFEDQIASKTDKELLDIYANPHDYQESFVSEVVRELSNRKVDLASVPQKKPITEEISQKQFETGRPGNELYIIICFASALLGGIIGIVGGYVYSQSEHQDNSGRKFYVYDKPTREKGIAMLIFGIVVPLATIVWRIS